jgi:hypothetical protein
MRSGRLPGKDDHDLSSYYYAVATLPMLKFNEAPPVSTEQFEELCREQLDTKDLALVIESKLNRYDRESKNTTFQAFIMWETALRNRIASMRGQLRSREYEEYLRPGEDILGMEEIAKDAFSISSPYEAELKLYSERWSYLDELDTNQFFNLETMTVYYLKLQILEKLKDFNREKGMAGLKEAYRRIREGSGDSADGKEADER